MNKFCHFLVLLLILYVFLINQEAYAYINPGSGSYIVQTVIGWFLSVGYFFKKLITIVLPKVSVFLLPKYGKSTKNKDVQGC